MRVADVGVVVDAGYWPRVLPSWSANVNQMHRWVSSVVTWVLVNVDPDCAGSSIAERDISALPFSIIYRILE